MVTVHATRLSCACVGLAFLGCSTVSALAPTTASLHVAPMQAYTNYHLRTLYQCLNPNVTLWTEMEKLADLQDPSGWSRRFGPSSRRRPHGASPLALQIGTNDPEQIRSVLPPLLQSYHFDEINLNCGCPSIQAGGASTYGASLMKQPVLTSQLVEALREVIQESPSPHTQVSLKCRIGVWETPDQPIGMAQMYHDLTHYLDTATRTAGTLQHVVLHARPVVLSGWSPVQNRCIPALDYPMVQQVAQDFSDLRVTLNGGIQSWDQVQILSSSCSPISSFMAGRWLLQRPLDLWKRQDDSQQRIEDAVENYLERAIRNHDKSTSLLQDVCLPLYLITEQLAHDYERSEDNETNGVTPNEMEHLYNAIVAGVQDLYDLTGKTSKRSLPKEDDMHFKKLRAALKGLVGTKVVNKWKRNRAEL